jgi:Zn-dependent peptidase ImmA (M78 family)
VYQCQQRQEWYRDYTRVRREGPVPFVGSLTTETDAVEAARAMHGVLSYAPEDRGPTWAEALRRLNEAADQRGILVMVSGIVGSNTHRKLDPREFRGFALADDLALLVFVNGSDTKAAQIFTLAHELAHLWLGQSAVSDADVEASASNAIERWRNQVAAEFLVPLDTLDADTAQPDLTGELDRVARVFKVSTLVVLRRIFDAGLLSERQYRSAYARERDRVLALMDQRPPGSGGSQRTSAILCWFSRRVATLTVKPRESRTRVLLRANLTAMVTVPMNPSRKYATRAISASPKPERAPMMMLTAAPPIRRRGMLSGFRSWRSTYT